MRQCSCNTLTNFSPCLSAQVWDNTNWGIDSVEAVEMSSKLLIGATTVITVGAMCL